MFSLRSLFGVVALLGGLASLSDGGPTHEVVWGFALPPGGPGALEPASDGYLWGVAGGGRPALGGANADGTIYKVKEDGSEWETILYFTGNGERNKGSDPQGGLLSAGAYLWGTTYAGGTSNLGTVFKLDPWTNELATVVEFTGNGPVRKGANPAQRLTRTSDGLLWGSTWAGGGAGLGTLFKLDPASGTFTTVVEFNGPAGPAVGAYPSGPLADDGGNFLWGLTGGGVGMGLGKGTLFKLNHGTGEFTTVIEFSGDGTGNKGSQPMGPLQADGVGYWWGTTTGSGSTSGADPPGYGTVFKVNAATGTLTTVVEFTGQSGARRGERPSGGAALDRAGFFWGSTQSGEDYGFGGLFKVKAATGAFTRIGPFTGVSGARKGSGPAASLVVAESGDVWGTTGSGGAVDRGTVFRVNPTTHGLTTLIEFTTSGTFNKGLSPFGGLTQDSDGRLWGTTALGGSANAGTIFSFDPVKGQFSSEFEFGTNAAGPKGNSPRGELWRDSTNRLWGTTAKGGAGDYGTVFSFDPPTHSLITPVEFTLAGAINRGSEPVAGLTADPSGVPWGTTRGTVFKLDTQSGVLTTVAEFGAPPGRPSASRARLLDDGQGFFWGTGAVGGSGAAGGIFKIEIASGALTTVASFSTIGPPLGDSPSAELTAVGQTHLWGTTGQGGSSSMGTVFNVNLATGETRISFSFTGNAGERPGMAPVGKLRLDGAGTLWGTSSRGGERNAGTIFTINPSSGAFSSILQFAGVGVKAHSGMSPRGALLMSGVDGALYGTTEAGGPNRGGTIYRLRFGQSPSTLPALAVVTTGVTLRGTVNPNGEGVTTVTFQYGTDPALVGATTVSAATLNNGTEAVPVSVVLSGLGAATTYYYRVVASNAGNALAQTGYVRSFLTPEATPLETWRQTHFGAPDNSGWGADTADPDEDGVPNLAEYAFGLDPKLTESSPLPAWERDGDTVAATFTAPSKLSGVTYAAEWSATMKADEWAPVPDTGVAPQHAFSVPLDNRSEIFLRFRVAVP